MITTLAGENDIERGAALKRLVDDFVAQYGDIAIERLDGDEASFERMTEAVQSLPFLAARKLVVLRAPGANKDFTERFEDFVASVSDSSDVIIVEPKLDKRLSYYKQLKKLTDFKDFTVLDAQGLARYATEYVKERGGVLALAEARFLVERIGTNQAMLQQELDKLLAYDSKVSRESVELLTEQKPQSTIFELLDAAFSGDTARTMKLYDEQRALKVEPQQIVAMLAWQLHVLALVKTAKDRTTDEIARQAKLSPYVIQKTQTLARRIKLADLTARITMLREFDIRMKSEGVIPDEVVRFYLLELSSV